MANGNLVLFLRGETSATPFWPPKRQKFGTLLPQSQDTSSAVLVVDPVSTCSAPEPRDSNVAAALLRTASRWHCMIPYPSSFPSFSPLL